MTRIIAGLQLFFVFLFEFLKASFSLAFVILFKKNTEITPCFAFFDVKGLTRMETLILAQLITLTPGSIVCEIDEENERFLIHILNTDDAATTLADIDRKFTHTLMKVTR